jgi:hypothetical protein
MRTSMIVFLMIKSRRRFPKHVTRMGEKRNVYRSLVGKPEVSYARLQAFTVVWFRSSQDGNVDIIKDSNLKSAKSCDP